MPSPTLKTVVAAQKAFEKKMSESLATITALLAQAIPAAAPGAAAAAAAAPGAVVPQVPAIAGLAQVGAPPAAVADAAQAPQVAPLNMAPAPAAAGDNGIPPGAAIAPIEAAPIPPFDAQGAALADNVAAMPANQNAAFFAALAAGNLPAALAAANGGIPLAPLVNNGMGHVNFNNNFVPHPPAAPGALVPPPPAGFAAPAGALPQPNAAQPAGYAQHAVPHPALGLDQESIDRINGFAGLAADRRQEVSVFNRAPNVPSASQLLARSLSKVLDDLHSEAEVPRLSDSDIQGFHGQTMAYYTEVVIRDPAISPEEQSGWLNNINTAVSVARLHGVVLAVKYFASIIRRSSAGSYNVVASSLDTESLEILKLDAAVARGRAPSAASARARRPLASKRASEFDRPGSSKQARGEHGRGASLRGQRAGAGRYAAHQGHSALQGPGAEPARFAAPQGLAAEAGRFSAPQAPRAGQPLSQAPRRV